MLGLIVLTGSALVGCGPGHPPEDEWPDNGYCAELEAWTSTWERYEWAVLERVNDVRAQGATCGNVELPPALPLRMDSRLHCAARAHALDLSDEPYPSHINDLGENPAERMKRAGYRYRTAGENIAVTTYPVVPLPTIVEVALLGAAAGLRPHPDPDHVVEVWLQSETHCRNLMSPAYADAGIGFVLGQGGAPIWTQSMGRPL